jgi:predicted RNA-binding Zn ribbon-like protein
MTLVNLPLDGYSLPFMERSTKARILSRQAYVKSHAVFLAGNPALDFLNTRMRVNHDLVDFLECDSDVLAWLKQAGLPFPVRDVEIEPFSLLRSARELRESTRILVEMRKAGQRGNPQVLNNYLAATEHHSQLVWKKAGSISIDVVWRQNTCGSILAPLAEVIAELLAFGNFDLIKRCEDESCVLWFSDQTKSHNRRWCSTQLCGNRQKVAAYRRRRRGK